MNTELCKMNEAIMKWLMCRHGQRDSIERCVCHVWRREERQISRGI